MRMRGGKKGRCPVFGTAAAVLLLFVAVCFAFSALAAPDGVACAETGELRLYAWSEGEDGSVTAMFTPADTEECYAVVPCESATYTRADGEFFYTSHYDVTFSARAAADAALAAAPEGMSVTEDNLKILFVYATMYESISSNAQRTESGGVWLHTLTADPDDGDVLFAAFTRNAESEKWYAMLTGIAVLAVAAAAAGVAAARSVKCRKNRNRPIA